MATIVGSIGRHAQSDISGADRKERPRLRAGLAYARLRQELASLKPDAIVIFDTDHLNTFFLDNLPIFAIGVDNSFAGPCDEVPLVPRYTAPSHRALASHLRSEAVAAGFDLALVQAFEADHSVFVPLHYLTPEMNIPVIPIFISGHNHFARQHMSPMPSARRCFELGQTVRAAIERVAAANARGHRRQRRDFARRPRYQDRARFVCRGSRSELGRTRPRTSQGQQHRRSGQRDNAGPASQCRQRFRRNAQLDRHDGQRQSRRTGMEQSIARRRLHLCGLALMRDGFRCAQPILRQSLLRRNFRRVG